MSVPKPVVVPSETHEAMKLYHQIFCGYVESIRKSSHSPVLTDALRPSQAARLVAAGPTFLRFPNALAADIDHAEGTLRILDGLPRAKLDQIAECHAINRRRLSRRSVVGWLPGIAGGSAALLGILKVMSDLGMTSRLSGILGPDVEAFATAVLIGTLVGSALGSLVNAAMSVPALAICTSLGELIALAKLRPVAVAPTPAAQRFTVRSPRAYR